MGNRLISMFSNVNAEVFECSQIELKGNTEMIIQGSRGIVEYSDVLVRVNMRDHQLAIEGRKLTIGCLTSDSMEVKGYIEAIRWI